MRAGPRWVLDICYIPIFFIEGRFMNDNRGKGGGRKSAASLTVSSTGPSRPHRAPDRDLPEAARRLWRAIVEPTPSDHFAAGDFPLLREYVITAGVLLPAIDKAILETGLDAGLLTQRDRLVRQLAALARSLRLCVSSRTRPDSASITRVRDGAVTIDFDSALRP